MEKLCKCHGCGGKCCYDPEIPVGNEKQLQALKKANPNLQIIKSPDDRIWVYIPGRCGNLDQETGLCKIHGTELLPDGCIDLEVGGEDCNFINQPENIPTGFVKPKAVLIPLSAIGEM